MKIKFTPGNVYKLSYKGVTGDCELVKISGGRYHIFSDQLGKDFSITKAEFITALEKGEELASALPMVTSSEELALIKKVHKPLGNPKAEAEKNLSEFDRMRELWFNNNSRGWSDDHREEMKAKADAIEIGAMYYIGDNRNGYRTYIVDGITEKPHPYRKQRGNPKEMEYSFKVRKWNWGSKTFGPQDHKSEGYEFVYDFNDFVKNIELPKLSKTPDLLWEEAEKALLNDDVDKYALDKAYQSNDGPDTQIMHMGSKEALKAIQKDMESKRGHAVAIQNTMQMIINKRMAELEKVKDRMYGMIKVFEKQIKKIMRVVTTIELYLGIEEEIVQIQEGPTASEDEVICIRQGLMFMDEEVGDPWDDGQGLEWDRKGVAAFDDWLTRNGNYKKVLPEKKGIAAFQARRNAKVRRGGYFENMSKIQADHTTFLLIRNGDNLYRLITDKISFRPRLFPRRNELQKLFDYWKVADNIEQKKEDPEAWMSLDGLSEKDKERFAKFYNSSEHRKVGDAKEFAEDSVFFYKMRITLFQGLLDRATILHPLKPNVEYKLFSPQAQEDGLVRLIYDDELTLPTGRKSFWNWMADLNSRIDYGSRIVLSHNWGYLRNVGGHQEMEDYEYAQAKDEHTSRLDDRYGSGHSGNWSHIPPRPNEGMYFVKKGERYQTEPVWIDNPDFNPDLLETKPEKSYSRTEAPEKFPKDLKEYNRNSHNGDNPHFETNPGIRMTYAEQIAYFGKVVEKGLHPTDLEKNVTGIYLHGIVRNARKIHKYTMVESKGWKDGEYVANGELDYKYEYHDVKYNFMCIRYNPKDKVNEYKMIRSWDDEGPSERKLNISWKIYNTDAFIINYDEIKVEDIDFYLESRVDRRHYTHMMPLLWKVRQTLIAEKQSEVDFKKLVQGEVLRATGTMPTDEQIDQEVENWKKNLKWKRAVNHDDEKALRMIVQKLSK